MYACEIGAYTCFFPAAVSSRWWCGGSIKLCLGQMELTWLEQNNRIFLLKFSSKLPTEHCVSPGPGRPEYAKKTRYTSQKKTHLQILIRCLLVLVLCTSFDSFAYHDCNTQRTSFCYIVFEFLPPMSQWTQKCLLFSSTVLRINSKTKYTSIIVINLFGV